VCVVWVCVGGFVCGCGWGVCVWVFFLFGGFVGGVCVCVCVWGICVVCVCGVCVVVCVCVCVWCVVYRNYICGHIYQDFIGTIHCCILSFDNS